MAVATTDGVVVRIEKLVAGGLGLARHEGGVVLVSDAAPDDLLEVEVLELRRGVRRARPRVIREAGPGRREPPCPYAGVCGGCDLQHLDYATQIAGKLAILREALVRTARIAPPERIAVHQSPEWGYRRRARFHVAHQGSGPRLGFRARRGHAVIAVGPCPVLVPELEQALPSLARSLPFAATEHRVIVTDDGIVAGASRGRIRIGGRDLWVDGRGFFQANVALVERLVERVVELAGTGSKALDLYAGVGVFATALRATHETVVAVEGDRGGYELLVVNLASQSGTRAVHAAVEDYVGAEPRALEDATVVVDPPRQGLAASVRAAFSEQRPRRLVYVSCDPATLARDVAALGHAGLMLVSLDLFDLFPQTHHIESVALFERAGELGASFRSSS